MTHARGIFAVWALLLGVLLAAGCTSTPQATAESDALAKEFRTHPSASMIYVYRNEFNYFDTDTILYVDGRVVGTTVPGMYFRIETAPGRHVLHGTGVDLGEITLETRPGELYIVELNVIGANSNFRLVSDEAGRERLRTCCTLLANFAPALRPLVLR